MAPTLNNGFDGKKAYVQQEETFFDDGREIALLHFVYGHPLVDEMRGSPLRVLQAIDEFGRSQKYLMNVGENKGSIVTDLISKIRPQTMVELGGYVGYSALLFGDTLRRAGGKRYFSLERNPEFAAVIKSLIDLAGLSDIVKVIVGSSGDSIKRLHSDGTIKHIDLMFLDHYKPAYVSDLKLCEQLQLITPGSVLAADNVISPGNPPYLEYVRSSVQEKKARYSKSDTNGDVISGFSDQTLDRYSKEKEKLGTIVKGNPNLEYESTLVESFEPTGIPDGVEITRCVGEHK